MVEQYFEFLYYRDFVVPCILAGLALIITFIVVIYGLFCNWNDRRHKR